MNLTTDAELAEILGLTTDEVHRFCRERGWPCVRPKRSIWRFTDVQVEQIVAMQSTKPKSSASTVRPTGRVPGQTARSAARSRSG